MLSAVYRDAMRRGGCSHKPFLPALPDLLQDAPDTDEAEEQAMLAGLLQRGEPGVHDVIVTLLDTGMRKGEVLALRPCDHHQPQHQHAGGVGKQGRPAPLCAHDGVLLS